MKTVSLRWRLLIWSSAASIFTLSLIVVLVDISFRNQIRTQLDASLSFALRVAEGAWAAQLDDRISEIAVLGSDYRDVDGLYAEIAAAAGPEVETLPWYELDTYLGTMLTVMDGFVLVWIVVVFLALSFGLVNTLMMAVFERVREIGLMLALGMKPGDILGQIIVESLCLLLIGLVVGNALAIATVIPLRDGIDISIVGEGMEMFGAASMLYPKLLASDMIMANVIVLVLGFLASLSPLPTGQPYQNKQNHQPGHQSLGDPAS